MQTNALLALKKLRDRRAQFQTWFERNEAERKIVRSITIVAIRLLNAEFRVENLPYNHPNPIEEVDTFNNGPLKHKKNIGE